MIIRPVAAPTRVSCGIVSQIQQKIRSGLRKMSDNWYIATVRPQQEQAASRDLRDIKFEVFLAKTYKKHKVGKHNAALATLRFPGYLFVRFDLAQGQSGPVLRVRGVSGLLQGRPSDSHKEYPQAIPSAVITALRQLEDEELEDAVRRVRRGRSDLTPGQAVRIDRHAIWRNHKAMLVASVRGMATLLVGNLVVTIPDCDICAIEEKKAAEDEDTKAA